MRGRVAVTDERHCPGNLTVTGFVEGFSFALWAFGTWWITPLIGARQPVHALDGGEPAVGAPAASMRATTAP
jgi:hypothetical protein